MKSFSIEHHTRLDSSMSLNQNGYRRVWFAVGLIVVALQTGFALFNSVKISDRLMALAAVPKLLEVTLLDTTIPAQQSPHYYVPKSPYAYAFVIGGCDPAYPAYKHYIYNILIATKNLRDRGSKAEVVVFFQMAWTANGTKLPSDDEHLFQEYDIRILYLPKNPNESFYRTMFDKFRILGLTEYERILFMDGDIMPMTNLDFLLELSGKGALRENVVMQGALEPVNGGLFILKPGSLQVINDIIQRRQEEAMHMEYPYFNMTTGWGHTFHPPEDGWQSRNSVGTDWDFHGGFADQGLLFYWVKYVSKDVSICMHNGTIQHWFSNESGSLQSETVPERDLFANVSEATKCWGKWCGRRPIRDFHHFTGNHKPWLHGPPQDLSKETSLLSSAHYWFWQLKLINEELQIGLNFSHWKKHQRPTLGLYPKYNSIRNASVNLLTAVE